MRRQSFEYCGGLNRLNVYQLGEASATDPSTTPGGCSSLGCYTDDASTRTLRLVQGVPGGSTNMTIDGCLTTCAKAGFSYSGLEFSQECWRGNSIEDGGSCASDQSTCYQSCRGNTAQICGGPDPLIVYYSGSSASGSCTAGAHPASTSRTTSSVVISASSSLTSATTSRASSTAPGSTRTSSSSKTSSTGSSSTKTISSSTTTTVSSSITTTSSSTTTTTSASLTSTGCRDFWSNVVDGLAPLMRVNGQRTDMARAAIRFAFHDSAAYSAKLHFQAPAAGGADGPLLLSSTVINRANNNGLSDYHGQLTK